MPRAPKARRPPHRASIAPWYPTQRRALVRAAAPIVRGIMALPSVSAQDRRRGAPSWTDHVVDTIMSEALARVEAGIYVAQRAGRSFGPRDVRGLRNFLATPAYWSPTPQEPSELDAFLKARAASIEAGLRLQVFALQDEYLKRRP